MSTRSSKTRKARAVLAVLLALGLVVSGPSSSWAWGVLGHRLVAKVAEANLNPKAREAVRELLDRDEDLADASTYADEHKREIRGSAPWHYVNVPIDADAYRSDFCGPQSCVVEKIKEFRRNLTNPELSQEDRQMALRFVVHLVGDIHQPLHVGDNHDRGGNSLQVRFFNKGLNLHKVWDFAMLERISTDEDDWIDDLNTLLDAGDNRNRFSGGSVEDWANESLRAARSAYLVPGTDQQIRPGQKLSTAYLDANLPIARQRIAQAGLRLAKLLNEAFPEN